jgi:hypothetical protein
MAHIQISLGPVIGDIHFTVLKGIHGTGINVDIGIKFLKGDGHAPAFKQGTNGRRGKPLSQGGKNASGDKNELSFIPRLCIHATILVRGKKENGSLTLPVFDDTPDGNLSYLIRGCLTTAGLDDFSPYFSTIFVAKA